MGLFIDQLCRLGLVLAHLALATSAAAGPVQQTPERNSAWGEVAARGGGLTLPWSAFDELLVARYAMSDDGRSALKQLVRARLLDRLARESKLDIGPAQVNARWAELDREVIASGEAGGLEAYIESQGVDRAVFLEFLRLAIVQETLARRALGLPAERAVNSEQQEMWLDQVVVQRGTLMPPPPWDDGVAARCGDLSLSVRDYTLFLRTQLAPELLRETCYQMLLERAVRARMPDLAPELLAAAVEVEVDRRRADVAADPKYKGLAYEQILAAQGMRLDTLRSDPALVTAALANLWIDQTYSEEKLRRVYAEERAWFDGRFGEFREVRAIFLKAAALKNALNPRNFADAEAQLVKVERQIGSIEDFEVQVVKVSEDVGSKDKQGQLGWVPRGDERVPEVIRESAFSETGRSVSGGRLLGPVRLPGGVALLWIGATRPAPGWEVMRTEVHRELRRRFLEESLARDTVVTYLDSD